MYSGEVCSTQERSESSSARMVPSSEGRSDHPMPEKGFAGKSICRLSQYNTELMKSLIHRCFAACHHIAAGSPVCLPIKFVIRLSFV